MRNATSVQAVLVQLFAAVSFGATALINVANADEYASPERTAAAVGHYARARALLIQALDEFEQGRKIARPDLLLDADEFRIALVSRAEELNRVLDPQPKVTRSGVRFKGSPDLIGDPRKEKTSTDMVAPQSAAASNSADTFGLGGSRGALDSAKSEAAPIEKKEKVKPAKSAKLKKSTPAAVEAEAVGTETLTVTTEDKIEPEAAAALPAAKSEAAAPPPVAGAEDEDPEVKQAIEQAIKERLDRIKADTDPSKVKH